MNTTDDIKHSLKLVKLCFLLILWVHLSGCIYVYFNTLVDDEVKWRPSQLDHLSVDEFDALGWFTRWKFTFYASLLGLLGNDIYPMSNIHLVCAYSMLIIGAFINAHIIGTITVMAQNLNKRFENY